MSERSRIEWTDATWNPVTGCTKVSPGCAHCYAEAVTLRFRRGGPYLPGKATIRLHHDRLADPGRWRRPRRVFVCSMSDLFHEEIPWDYVTAVFDRMSRHSQHIYQVLTKRPERMAEYSARMDTWPAHVWAGVSVENQLWADRRIPLLTAVPAAVRFLSVEPLLKPVELSPYLGGVHWVIVGGGNRGRGQGRWRPSGSGACETTVWRLASRSFSSSGAAGRPNRGAASSTAGRGTRCREGGEGELLRIMWKVLIGTVALAFAVMMLTVAWWMWGSGVYYCADANDRPIRYATTDDGSRMGPRHDDLTGGPCGTFARRGLVVQNTSIALNTVRFGGALFIAAAAVVMYGCLIVRVYKRGRVECEST